MSDGGCVVNVQDCESGWQERDDHVYIGRSAIYSPTGWGNPYAIGADGMTRDEVLSLYVAWLQTQVKGNSSFPHRVHGLYGKVLVCHCAPRPCHGDFLLRLANGLAALERLHKREPKDFTNISIFGDEQRLTHMRDLVHEVTLAHGRRIRSEMRQAAEKAAKDELGNGDADYSKWLAFRTKWLNPLLRFDLPAYRDPMIQGG